MLTKVNIFKEFYYNQYSLNNFELSLTRSFLSLFRLSKLRNSDPKERTLALFLFCLLIQQLWVYFLSVLVSENV